MQLSIVDLILTSINPDKYGFQPCTHCNGYGSSLKDRPETDRCSKCEGSGLEKKNDLNY